MEAQDDNLIETKYQRVGHINEGRLCDTLASYCAAKLPGTVLPKRWKYDSSDKFVSTFGKEPHWAITRSYHCYLVEGHHVFRVWTDAGKKAACVDVPSHLAAAISLTHDVVLIPPGSLFKCRPLTHRLKVKTVEDMQAVVSMVKSIYGV